VGELRFPKKMKDLDSLREDFQVRNLSPVIDYASVRPRDGSMHHDIWTNTCDHFSSGDPANFGVTQHNTDNNNFIPNMEKKLKVKNDRCRSE
jgi:hypothetical protein